MILSHIGMEKDLKEEISSIQVKIDMLRKQLSDAQESLQLKSVELEKERSNISHLVDVTSAYIKELESSLTESREKIEELESVVEEARSNNGKRMPPDGISGKEREDSLSDQSDLEGGVSDKDLGLERERLNSENELLKAKLLNLESELSTVKSNFDEERQELLEVHRTQTQENGQGTLDLDKQDGSEENTTMLEADSSLQR